jgi:hypothetical protein
MVISDGVMSSSTSLLSLPPVRTRLLSGQSGAQCSALRYTAIYSGWTHVAYAIAFPATTNLLLQILYRMAIPYPVWTFLD